MKIDVNGTIRHMTEEELRAISTAFPLPSYEERIVSRIREVYSVDDELAILRQKDTKPEEFAEYNNTVEEIKTEERLRENERIRLS